jgi:GTP-binding protein HflX
LFERPRTGERVLLVHLALIGVIDEASDIAEFEELALSAGAECAGVIQGSRRTPDARFFVGRGKVEEIRDTVHATGAEVVIFNHPLSPNQERNLEAFLKCRVLDRAALILDIFAQRARSFEGKLQVELAQLRHLSTRLVRGWTHLERQKGGIGLRGPGETQLETDRRLLSERIKQVNRRLRKVDRQRHQGRRSRRKADIPTVSVVGYTNAGKSSLFNRLTEAQVYAADQLFATLDPTLRRVALPNGDSAVLADTVGFISHLPHELISAFRSTLQETCEADLLLHVVDARDPRHRELMDHVERILDEIGAGEIPRIRVFNKIDLLDLTPRVEHCSRGRARAVWVSAATGIGMDHLREAIATHFHKDAVHGWVRLSPDAGRLRARLFNIGAVAEEKLELNGDWSIKLRVSRKNLQQLCQQEGFRKGWTPTIS